MLTHARIRARQNLSEHDVLTLLNFELSAYEECADCHFTSVKLSGVVDESGCNWRGADLQLDGATTAAAHTITKQVVDEVRETYNVA
jgi:hypothetical protein